MIKLPLRDKASQPPAAFDRRLATPRSTEIGKIASPESSIKYMYQQMFVDPDLRAAILDIRRMDKEDGRVKKIHKRMAADITKGGLMLHWGGTPNERIQKLWSAFVGRADLSNRNKLISDARGLVMEGNVVLQNVVDTDRRQVLKAIRMPAETIVPQVDENGRFKDIMDAYHQVDYYTGRVIAHFPALQLVVNRLDPENYDDMGALGRPYLDSSRGTHKKLMMSDEDLVIHRRHRAPQRLLHVLENASQPDMDTYQAGVEAHSGEIQTDFYMNKKGSIQAIQGDAHMEKIADLKYLLDTFYAGAPGPKGLFGYADGLNRDVLEDLLRDYYEEIDSLQDLLSASYYETFRLELLLNSINPDRYDFSVVFAERRTETRNQRADYALKLQAMGAPAHIIWETAGLDVQRVQALKKKEQNSNSPYPSADDDDDDDTPPTSSGKPKVSITPGNAPKGESQTTISNN